MQMKWWKILTHQDTFPNKNKKQSPKSEKAYFLNK